MRATTVGAAFAAVLLAALLTTPREASPRALLPLPPPEKVWAERLDDGTPVFVAHQPDGAVHVLGAEMPFDIVDVGGIGWCPQVQRFIQVWGAAQFRRDGTWLGGPAPGSMERYRATVRDGRVRVGASQGMPPRDAPSPYRFGEARFNECYHFSQGHDLDLEQVLLHGEPFGDAVTVARLRAMRDGSAIVFGNAVGRADGGIDCATSYRARVRPAAPTPWCATVTAGGTFPCSATRAGSRSKCAKGFRCVWPCAR